MIRVAIEVVSRDAARLRVSIQADSIRRAVSVVEPVYPKADIRVLHPIEPETFFVRDTAASTGMVESERPKRVVRQAAGIGLRNHNDTRSYPRER